MGVCIMNRRLHGEKVECCQEQLLVFNFTLKQRSVAPFRGRLLIHRFIQIVYGDIPIG
jgi:hypothetical protein